MYARKVALLQVLKYMPSSIELANAVEISNATESGKGAVLEGNFVREMDIEPAYTSGGSVDQSTGEIVAPKSVADRIAVAAMDELILIDEEVRAMANGPEKTKHEAAIKARFDTLNIATAGA
jgi:recombination protein RecT